MMEVGFTGIHLKEFATMSSKKSKQRTSKNRRRKTASSAQPYVKLEPRKLLAITLVDGIVEIEGTIEDDVVTVEPIGDSAISVSLNSDESIRFSVEDVIRVRFRGLRGDDTFTNNSDVDSTAFGHDGDDVFIGGGGNNRFQGGDGRDVLTGGPRNDVIRGRDGLSLIHI